MSSQTYVQHIAYTQLHISYHSPLEPVHCNYPYTSTTHTTSIVSPQPHQTSTSAITPLTPCLCHFFLPTSIQLQLCIPYNTLSHLPTPSTNKNNITTSNNTTVQHFDHPLQHNFHHPTSTYHCCTQQLPSTAHTSHKLLSVNILSSTTTNITPPHHPLQCSRIPVAQAPLSPSIANITTTSISTYTKLLH
jgi:hypothetical protein